MHEESNKTIESPQSLWWLAKNAQAEGPLSQQEVCDALKSNHVSSTDYAYSTEERAWKPLSDWNEFESGTENSGLESPPAPPVECYRIDPLFTNDRLPPMANWICIYTLLISPWLWFFYAVSQMTSGTVLAENAPLMGVEALAMLIGILASLAVTVSLFIGGMRLRALRRSGPTIIILSIVVATAVLLLLIFCLIVLMAMSDQSNLASKTVAVELIDYFVGIVGLCEAAFMVTALLWLRRNERFLPLS
ncbi:GYF domain-containing protein [uncultured Gimesia sp.]|uniref:GYF domain-containing protein n=1 Tax=uncultured Gimesia sp. TaxID=1678688 RepID=UPI00260CB679|nr:GYF domain-containing protein [uncultured Gimesia sp.]